MGNAWLNKDIVRKQVEIVGLVDVRKEAARNRAEQHGFDDAVIGDDLSGVLKEAKPQVVFDCTIPEAHCEVTVTALRHGCHVLGEKPMADSMPNARRMVRAAERAGRMYAVMQNRRYHAAIRDLRRFLDSGAIGKVTTVQSDFFIGAHFEGFRKEMEHVLLLDMAIHTFDAARLITGADATSVSCHEWNPHGSSFRHGASASAVFEMGGGVVYNYHGSWCAEGCSTSWEGAWRIVGERGTVLWDGGDGLRCEIVKERRTGRRWQTVERSVPRRCPKRLTGGHDGAMREFIACVRNGSTPETICTDNIKSLAMVHAAIRSSEQGRRVKVDAGLSTACSRKRVTRRTASVD